MQDDGVGLPDGGLQGQQASDRVVAEEWRVATDHFGLIGIEERAAQLNGTLRLRSARGQGTWLRVEFPLEAISMPTTVLICDDHDIVAPA